MIDSFAIWLLAQRSRWERLGDGFRGHRARLDTTESVIGVLVIVVIFAALIILARYGLRDDKDRPTNNPWQLFWELCRAHGLSRRESRLLCRLAKERKLSNPGDIFVDPRFFDTSTLPRSLKRRSAEFVNLMPRLMDASQLEDLFTQRHQRRAQAKTAEGGPEVRRGISPIGASQPEASAGTPPTPVG